ncbi:MAG: nitroreductase family protein [Anaerolineae bacterium]
MTDWIAAIRQRHSVRRYADQPLPAEMVAALCQTIAEVAPLDAGVPVTLSLLPFAEIGRRSAVGAVVILNPAPWYMIAHSPATPGRMEEVGFRMEQVVLAATSLRLGTCWIGGYFRAGALAERLGCPPGDIIAISPLGWPQGGRLQALTYTVSESFAFKRGKRKPLEDFCFWETWGQPLRQAQVPAAIWEALELARLAPSWSNVQPWYFLAREGEVYALADNRPKRTNARPDKPYYQLDTGIAMSHFWLAMCQRGHAGRWLPLRGAEEALRASLTLPEYALPIGRYYQG